ncbi:cilia- and flagella-associated protein 52 isoform X2 [Pseudomyrmex gracilis]|uniref:cilia- and flagella-associated protein 52 isoform X2 n=1 Tax=Pseudomyrmex gracilis TaxID=219809 RepID=UPI000995D3DE|nr:cilia- and flagella-associated protein 52 isoform X2 [Pseudomyrmex gracilis]
MEPRDLELLGIIAFDGITKNGLRLHPDEKHILYPMGCKVVVRNIETGQQRFLSGHSNTVSTLCVSRCGKYVASGQNNHHGFKAMVIVWNYENGTMRGSYETHKVCIEDLCFTCNGDFLVSLGGRDDGNVIVWDVQKNSLICGSYASNETSGNAYNVTGMHLNNEYFVTAGDRTLRIWRVDAEKRKLQGMDVEVGKLKRLVNCLVVDESDEMIYCGTTSGDIIKARLNLMRGDTQLAQTPVMIGCYSKITRDPRKMKTGEGDPYAGGVNSLLLLKNGRTGSEELVVGTGDGTIELIEIISKKNGRPTQKKPTKFPNTPQILTHQRENLCSAITSIVLYQNEHVLVGTSWCEIYQVRLSNFHAHLLVTSHTSCIYSLAFPRNHSETFATGGKNDVRLWQLETQKETLRISVPNFVCSSLQFAHNDQMLFSAWNDGIIRVFEPRTGQLHFSIYNAHTKAVSTIAVTSDGSTLISGGCDGQVRIWEIKPDVQRLIGILKEHRGPITSLHISCNNEDLISSSTDGTCVVWDITRRVRKHILMENTMFMMAQFTPDGIQILTCGTDRKITYWETLDCSMVREIEGSSVGAMNCLDISSDGRCFVTGSNDCTVRFWQYESADLTHVGVSHAAIITVCKFSADGRYIVTTSADGEIAIWKCPVETAEDSKSVARSGRTSSTTRRLREQDKLSLRKAESAGDAADQTERSLKKSASSCASDNQRERLSVTSERSKDSKTEDRDEKMSVCKQVTQRSNTNSKASDTTNRCSVARSNASSTKTRTIIDRAKEPSDQRSRRSNT